MILLHGQVAPDDDRPGRRVPVGRQVGSQPRGQLFEQPLPQRSYEALALRPKKWVIEQEAPSLHVDDFQHPVVVVLNTGNKNDVHRVQAQIAVAPPVSYTVVVVSATLQQPS